jgi:hypothetical protein
MSKAKAEDVRARYVSYTGGFRDGAAVNAMKYPQNEDYNRGYRDGQRARREAGDRFAQEIGMGSAPKVRLAGSS